MPTPADQRLLELIDKWLSSLELHLKYSALDEETYRKVQPWVDHQRPSRWIIELAQQKTLALREEVERRIEAQDQNFADSLELMAFLANLVGSQHIERFIPLADSGSERWVSSNSARVKALVEQASLAATVELLKPPPPPLSATGTREMPRFVATPQTPPPQPVTTPQITRVERKAQKPSPKSSTRASGKPSESAPALAEGMREKVIADAARLLQWGRKWYELAELISRMADRPSLPDVRRLLKDQKENIEKLAGR